MYATEKPIKLKLFNQIAQYALAACLIGVLLLSPVNGTISYVTSQTVTLVNTFEGVTEAEPVTPVTPATPDTPTEGTEDAGEDTDAGSSGSSLQTADAPQTGDEAPILLYTVTAAIGIAALIVITLIIYRRSGTNKEKRVKKK